MTNLGKKAQVFIIRKRLTGNRTEKSVNRTEKPVNRNFRFGYGSGLDEPKFSVNRKTVNRNIRFGYGLEFF